MLKLAITLLAAILIALQFKVWFSDVGHFAAADLKQEILEQQARAQRVTAANEQLVAQVHALRSGTDAIEASARADLGMIRQGEEYYVVATPAWKDMGEQMPATTAGDGTQLPLAPQ